MKKVIYILPLTLILIGCGKKTESKSDEGTPIDTYRKGIDRAREVQQKSVEQSKAMDSISQGDQ